MYKVCPTCDEIIYIDESHKSCPECGQDLFNDWKTNDNRRNICKTRCDLKYSECQKKCRFAKYITPVENITDLIDILEEEAKETSLNNTESELSLIAKERLRKEHELSDACFHTWIQPLHLSIDRQRPITTVNIKVPFNDICTDYVKQKYTNPLQEIVSDILQEDVALNCN